MTNDKWLMLFFVLSLLLYWIQIFPSQKNQTTTKPDQQQPHGTINWTTTAIKGYVQSSPIPQDVNNITLQAGRKVGSKILEDLNWIETKIKRWFHPTSIQVPNEILRHNCYQLKRWWSCLNGLENSISLETLYWLLRISITPRGQSCKPRANSDLFAREESLPDNDDAEIVLVEGIKALHVKMTRYCNWTKNKT